MVFSAGVVGNLSCSLYVLICLLVIKAVIYETLEFLFMVFAENGLFEIVPSRITSGLGIASGWHTGSCLHSYLSVAYLVNNFDKMF